MADIFKEDQAICGILHDDVVEFGGTGEPAHDAHWNLEGLLRVGRRLTELPGRDLDILLHQGIDHIGGGQAVSGQAHWVKPDAHGVFALAKDDDVANAGHALDGVLHIHIEVVGDELAGIASVLRIKACAQDKVAVGLGNGDAGGVDRRGQPAFHAGHAVLHIDGGNVEVVAGGECGGDGAGSAVGAG